MNTLILKLGATGDVVRTTPLLNALPGKIAWITAQNNLELLDRISPNLNALAWEERSEVLKHKYDLLINLEDDLETSRFAAQVNKARQFGAFLAADEQVSYTRDSSAWFDLSLISTYGRARADHLKLHNRRSYQELIFSGLGKAFNGERYVLPKSIETGLLGDVALAPVAGAIWPMKNWAFYDLLRSRLTDIGLVVNILPIRHSIREHIADIEGHRCLVSGDSLPMHLAMGAGVRCVTLFNCTSPWEIFGYGLQTQIVSPFLDEYFYKRDFHSRATTAIDVSLVFDAVRAFVCAHSDIDRRIDQRPVPNPA